MEEMSHLRKIMDQTEKSLQTNILNLESKLQSKDKEISKLNKNY